MNSKKIDLSDIQKKLPAQPGILGKSKYFNSAVFIPLVKINGDYHLLFEKRAKGIRQESEICFPGGEYDPKTDKTFIDTAVRETVEELGIKEDKISVLGNFDILVGPMGVTVDPVLGTIKTESPMELPFDRTEVEKVFTIPLSYFVETKPEIFHLRTEVQPDYIDENGAKIVLFPTKELGLPEKYWKPWHTRKQRILVYKTDEGVIWGLTARLIEELILIINS